jgi:hypothetical protein
MKTRLAIYLGGIYLFFSLSSQNSNLSEISFSCDENFKGFDQIQISDEKLFVLAEHWHNIKSVPKATLKLFRYLHENANVRILAIEQGASAAFMVNDYLASGDTSMLRDIARNTMFWGRENYAFFQDLRAFNETLPDTEKITVRSIDIEYKMESAVYVINHLIGNKNVPDELASTVGAFKQIFEQTRNHREQYQAMAVMFYYDKEFITGLVNHTYDHITEHPEMYQTFFDVDFTQFATMIQDMSDGLHFDYTNPNTKYRFRDRLIHEKFLDLFTAEPDKGVLCVIGERHALPGSSISKLESSDDSPVKDRVMKIRISALFNGAFLSSEIRRIHFSFPNVLKKNNATLIVHDPNDPSVKTKQGFDYTFFINEEGMLTKFNKVYTGAY